MRQIDPNAIKNLICGNYAHANVQLGGGSGKVGGEIMLLYLSPYTEAWINADTGETSVREPYKVIYWVLRKSGQAKEGTGCP